MAADANVTAVAAATGTDLEAEAVEATVVAVADGRAAARLAEATEDRAVGVEASRPDPAVSAAEGDTDVAVNAETTSTAFRTALADGDTDALVDAEAASGPDFSADPAVARATELDAGAAIEASTSGPVDENAEIPVEADTEITRAADREADPVFVTEDEAETGRGPELVAVAKPVTVTGTSPSWSVGVIHPGPGGDPTKGASAEAVSAVDADSTKRATSEASTLDEIADSASTSKSAMRGGPRAQPPSWRLDD